MILAMGTGETRWKPLRMGRWECSGGDMVERNGEEIGGG